MSTEHDPAKHPPVLHQDRSPDIPKPSPVTHHHHRDSKPPQLPIKPTYPRKMMSANIRQTRQKK